MGATIYNSNLTKELIEGAKIQISQGQIPGELAEKVIPVMEVNPKILTPSIILAEVTNRTTTATGVTLWSAANNFSSSKDVYITGLRVTNTQDATSDNTSIVVQGNFNGVQKNIYIRTKPTLTASSTMDYMEFKTPLKIDRNSLVVFSCIFSVGTSRTDIDLYGFTLDNGNA